MSATAEDTVLTMVRRAQFEGASMSVTLTGEQRESYVGPVVYISPTGASFALSALVRNAAGRNARRRVDIPVDHVLEATLVGARSGGYSAD